MPVWRSTTLSTLAEGHKAADNMPIPGRPRLQALKAPIATQAYDRAHL
jgi:hypothetical protein